MKSLIQSIRTSIQAIESIPTNYVLWITSFTSLILARLMVENWIGVFETHSVQFFFYEFTHTFFFFLFSFLVLWPLVAFFGKTSLPQASTVLLFGFLIILTPPILDVWISHGAHLWSFYKFDSLLGLWHRYYTLFGDRPDIGITYGVRVEVALVTLFIGLYTYIKTHTFTRALGSMFAVYSALFVLGTFPSWITFILLLFQKNIFTINAIDIAQVFLSPPTLFARSDFEFISALNIKMSLLYAPLSGTLIFFYLYRSFPQTFFALARNIRIPQVIYHGGLLIVGMTLARTLTSSTVFFSFFTLVAFVNICLAVGFAWIASVIVNDLFDQKIDAITNPKRPLQQKDFSTEAYKAIGITFFLASIVFSAMVNFKAAALLLIYQALAWMYSAWPLRLKRFPFVATFFAALACMLILIIGFILMAPNENIEKLPLSFILFFLFALTAILPFKDFRDIQGDSADGVYTIPVLFGEQWGKIIIGSSIFLTYTTSIFIVHEYRLLWWALLCGSLSFWLLMLSNADETFLFSYRKLPGWLLTILAVYGILCVYMLFF